jgi:SAM-dependent methyltransferase
MYAAHDYLNHQYGYKLRPALLGGCLLTALPSFARFAEISIRHLPIATSHSCTLLDVGCGDGNFLLEAERLGYKAVGLEPDEMAVKNANRKGLVVKAGRLPASELPYNSFSHVTMSHVVEHLHDPCEALREVYMLMQPQGRLWLATPNLNTIQHYKSWALAYHLDPPRHLVLFDSDALRVTLQKAGFTSIQIVAPRPDETRIFQSMAGATNVFSPLQDRTVVCSAANEEHTLDQQDKQGEELFAVAYKD